MGIGGGFGIGGIRALWGGMFFSMSLRSTADENIV
jgi:hypothetical protein